MSNAQCISDPRHDHYDHHDHHDHHDRPDRPDFHNHHDHHDHGDHEEVGGFTPASWRLSDHVCTHCRVDLSDGQWWINHSVRPICRYRATRAAKNLELNIKLVICSYFCSNSNIVFFIFNPSSLIDMICSSDLQILQQVHFASMAKYSIMNRQNFTEFPPSNFRGGGG